MFDFWTEPRNISMTESKDSQKSALTLRALQWLDFKPLPKMSTFPSFLSFALPIWEDKVGSKIPREHIHFQDSSS